MSESAPIKNQNQVFNNNPKQNQQQPHLNAQTSINNLPSSQPITTDSTAKKILLQKTLFSCQDLYIQVLLFQFVKSFMTLLFYFVVSIIIESNLKIQKTSNQDQKQKLRNEKTNASTIIIVIICLEAVIRVAILLQNYWCFQLSIRKQDNIKKLLEGLKYITIKKNRIKNIGIIIQITTTSIIFFMRIYLGNKQQDSQKNGYIVLGVLLAVILVKISYSIWKDRGEGKELEEIDRLWKNVTDVNQAIQYIINGGFMIVSILVAFCDNNCSGQIKGLVSAIGVAVFLSLVAVVIIKKIYNQVDDCFMFL